MRPTSRLPQATKAVLAIALLGLVIILLPRAHLNNHLEYSEQSFPNRTYTSSALDFFRPWQTPWGRSQNDRQATAFDTAGPECVKTLLYRFAGSHGFASEYLIFLRVVILAKHFGFEVIIDDSKWNYGKWTDYFAPLQLSCSRPRRVKNSERTPLGPSAGDPPLAFIKAVDAHPQWTRAAHVVWSVRRLDYLDQMILGLYTNSSEVEALHAQDRVSKAISPPLDVSHTLPLAYNNVFDIMGAEIQRLWCLNPDLQVRVNSAASSILSEPVNHPLLIAAHVRLGDKFLELHKFGPAALPTPRKTFQQLYKSWIEHQAFSSPPSGGKPDIKLNAKPEGTVLGSGLPSSRLHIVRRRPRSKLTAGNVQCLYVDAARSLENEVRAHKLEPKKKESDPLLLIISDDSSGAGLARLLRYKPIRQFQVYVGVDALLDGKQSGARHREQDVIGSIGLEPKEDVSHGFHEAAFNALPLSQRVADTMLFLRDLTVTARVADGLVFTGSSNVGRLLALLNAQDRNRQKLFHSADVRWFPTSRYL